MNWGEQFQDLIVSMSLAAFYYVLSGPIFRSVNPAGKISWRGRRWRKGWTLALLLFFGVLNVRALFRDGHIGIVAAVTLCLTFGLLGLILLRWWWQDWQKEKAALAALIERAHQEGRELVAPQMSRGKKVWNWVLIVYGGLGLLGGLYAIISHLVGKAH